MPEEQSVDHYLEALASSAATPGGGAAAGMSGAQACALMAMVCRLTKEHEARTQAILERAEQSRKRFMELTADDVDAFNDVMTAYRLPAGKRKKPLQQALKVAAAVPLTMIDETTALIGDVAELAGIGNPNLITDVGIAAILLDATIRSSRLNVLINLKSIDDDEFVSTANRRLDAANAGLAGLEQANTDILSRLKAR
jgi:formiminotetrahydrofolate cyclodeaminase